MEKPLYPSAYMRITQGYMTGTHSDSYAIDEAGRDTSISSMRAPFTGVVKKIYTADANEVWLESVDKVKYPDGTEDYMTILFCHDNDVSDLFIGKVINKGTEFYQEGTKGNASGNHCHIECARGKFTGTGWHKNKSGYWSINNGKKPEECLWIDDSITIINNKGYEFKKIEESNNTPVPVTPSNPEPPNNNDDKKDDTSNDNKSDINSDIKLIFTCDSTDIYAIKLKKGQKLYIK